MTTDTIESLEAKLAAMTEPCPDCHYLGERVQEPQGCKLCSGTGVVQLIKGSRRKCEDCKGEGILLVDHFSHGPIVRPLIRRPETCKPCNGLRYIPDLSMSKLIRHMQRHRVVRFAEIRRDITTVTWGLAEEEDADPYHALLLVCYEGEEAQEASDGS